ncbi:hypothetical protein IWQ57_003852 [Coemansia nantahalensis]|uniref:Uncharacterized protein n=1 Tax=Coemansia nantahalensis TaxID=2789366 RepID=A0ACC1JUR2_9FUNG|nr:hypothetical protein IWQ57_003852 [Coemansia nantahalensis]
MTRRRLAITEKVPTTPRKVVVYTDNLMTSNGVRNATAQESDKELEYALGDTLNTALVISTSYRFDPELNMLEILDPHNPRNHIEVKGLTDYQVSVKLFILPAAVDVNRRPSPLYVKQALTCIRKQLGAVTIEELFVSFADVSAGRDSATAPEAAAAATATSPGAAVLTNGSAGSLPLHPQEPDQLPTRRNRSRDDRRGHKARGLDRRRPGEAGEVPGNGDGGNDDFEASDMSRYLKIWRLLSHLKAEGHVTRIGICDATKQQLENLHWLSGVMPDMVQIRVDDSQLSVDDESATGEADGPSDARAGDSDASRELREYALAHKISVRSHSDAPKMLTNANFQTLAADYRINERFPTTEVPPEGYRIDLMRPRWVANYNVALRNRGLVANRGYIVMASSDCVLDPNRVSRFAYPS